VWAIWAAVAVAAEPAVLVEDDGTVQVAVDVDVPARDVRAALAPTLDSMRLSPDVLSVRVGGLQANGCEELVAETRGLTRPLVLRALRCPTKDGWSMQLLESADFTRYASEWRVTEEGGRTMVMLRTQAEPNVPVPRFLVLRGIRDAAVNAVLALKQLLKGG
jgi:hypothetical protein